MLARTGVGLAGLVMVKGRALEATPSCLTVTLAVPGWAMRAAGTAAVSWAAESWVVGRAVPFHSTRAPGSKPLPFTVSVKAGPPASAEFGERVVRVAGTGARTKMVPLPVAPPLEVTP